MTVGNLMQLSLWTDSLIAAVDAWIQTSAVVVGFDVVAGNRLWAKITIDIIVAVTLCFYDVAEIGIIIDTSSSSEHDYYCNGHWHQAKFPIDEEEEEEEATMTTTTDHNENGFARVLEVPVVSVNAGGDAPPAGGLTPPR